MPHWGERGAARLGRSRRQERRERGPCLPEGSARFCPTRARRARGRGPARRSHALCRGVGGARWARVERRLRGLASGLAGKNAVSAATLAGAKRAVLSRVREARTAAPPRRRGHRNKSVLRLCLQRPRMSSCSKASAEMPTEIRHSHFAATFRSDCLTRTSRSGQMSMFGPQRCVFLEGAGAL